MFLNRLQSGLICRMQFGESLRVISWKCSRNSGGQNGNIVGAKGGYEEMAQRW